MNNNREYIEEAGPPMPDFRSPGIQLQTVAPAFGLTTGGGGNNTPDYLDYDPKARGFNTVFGNAGMAYLMGIGGGGLYGFRQGLKSTPSTRWRVQFNSVLNHCGRYGSRAGNTLGVFAVLYSLYEVMADQVCNGKHLPHHHQVFCALSTLLVSEITLPLSTQNLYVFTNVPSHSTI